MPEDYPPAPPALNPIDNFTNDELICIVKIYCATESITVPPKGNIFDAAYNELQKRMGIK